MKTTRNSRLIARLAALKEQPVLPSWMPPLLTGQPSCVSTRAAHDDLRQVWREAEAVSRARLRLEGLPPAWRLESSLL